MITNQEIFDRVVAHALKQRARSISETGNCRYRGPDGTKCFVGLFINDEHYTRMLEGRTLGYVKIRAALEASGFIPADHTGWDLLADLQHMHDFSAPNDWALHFARRAHKYGLRYDPTASSI